MEPMINRTGTAQQLREAYGMTPPMRWAKKPYSAISVDHAQRRWGYRAWTALRAILWGLHTARFSAEITLWLRGMSAWRFCEVVAEVARESGSETMHDGVEYVNKRSDWQRRAERWLEAKQRQIAERNARLHGNTPPVYERAALPPGLTFRDPSSHSLIEAAARRGVNFDERIYRACQRASEQDGIDVANPLTELALVAETLQYATLGNLKAVSLRDDAIGARGRSVLSRLNE